MTAQEMWTLFTAQQHEATSASFEAWAYGDAPDELASLTLSGVKMATASAFALYELEGEALPKTGDYSVILDSKSEAVCIIRNAQVRVVPYREVDARQAYLEGEGDRSLSHWRRVHEAFFRREFEQYGLPFTEDIAVVCEEFEVVYP